MKDIFLGLQIFNIDILHQWQDIYFIRSQYIFTLDTLDTRYTRSHFTLSLFRLSFSFKKLSNYLKLSLEISNAMSYSKLF